MLSTRSPAQDLPGDQDTKSRDYLRGPTLYFEPAGNGQNNSLHATWFGYLLHFTKY